VLTLILSRVIKNKTELLEAIKQRLYPRYLRFSLMIADILDNGIGSELPIFCLTLLAFMVQFGSFQSFRSWFSFDLFKRDTKSSASHNVKIVKMFSPTYL